MEPRDYMKRAIELAKKGRGWTNPNPMVGAVIVKDGRIIGEGYHEKYGELHAERNAIASLKESAEGAVMYVTLEPCCHYGKTPPCTEAIMEQKIAKVVIGSRDPNPKVAGKGISRLRAAGIEVEEDFMRQECDRLNPIFFHYITTKTPYVVMKYAMTADGKIASESGKSRWITGEDARMEVQKMRHQYTAIMVGIGTVLADDPMLNVRIDNLKSPVRVICDSGLRIPQECQICRTAKEYPTIVAYAAKNEKREALLREKGIELVYMPDKEGRVDLKKLMEYLGEKKIDSVFLEGGGMLNSGALKAGIVQEVKAFIAPKIFGGKNAPSPVAGGGVDSPEQAYRLELLETTVVGADLLLNYQVNKIPICP